ncbi:MAG: hypothetical protein EAY75_11935 [Bacteroidetes bacterium]|nr:MAG: hypothetical protein EAY75_11935 [Bacteroidota bacterium]
MAKSKIQRLTHHGPLVEAEIYTSEVAFLSQKNETDTLPHAKVKLLVDTGSNISGIDKKLVSRLALNPYLDSISVDGVGGVHEISRYRCVLFTNIFGNKGLPLDVVEGDFSRSPYDGIIGRDVLQYCRLVYDGPGNQFTLEAIDF